MNTLLKTATIGITISLLALVISLALPIFMGPAISWDEAKIGYIPSGIALLMFLILPAFSTHKPKPQTDKATTGSWGKSLVNVLAAGALIGGGVGAGFCGLKAAESLTIARDDSARAARLSEEIRVMKTKPEMEASPELAELEKQLGWTDPEPYFDDYRLFFRWGLGSGGIVLLGLGWFVISFLKRR